MAQYFLFTDDYPFSADFDLLEFVADDFVCLVSRRPDIVVTEKQRSCLDLVIKLDSFTEAEVVKAIDRNVVVERGAVALSHDDFIYREIAAAVQYYGMKGMTLNGVLPFLDKAEAKRLLLLECISFPRYHLLDRKTRTLSAPETTATLPISNLDFPVFVKPLHGAGAEHASKIDTADEFNAWLECGQLPDRFEIDEFIGDATLFHCELLIDGHQISPIQVCEYCYPCADFAKGRPVGSFTMDMASDSTAQHIAEFAQRSLKAMARHVTLPNGVVHLEAFRRASAEILFLEAQLRPPGAYAKQLYSLRYGLDLEAIHLQLQMGRAVETPVAAGPYAAWIYFPTRNGTISALEALPALRSLVVQCDWRVEVGQKIKLPNSILDAAGRGVVALSVVISNNDIDQLREDFLQLTEFEPLLLA
jgi:hypothetical protein